MQTTLTEDYLIDNQGSVEKFRYALIIGQRLGQAFVNALSDADRDRLSGTIRDPFYSNKQEDLWDAIEWLIDHP